MKKYKKITNKELMEALEELKKASEDNKVTVPYILQPSPIIIERHTHCTCQNCHPVNIYPSHWYYGSSYTSPILTNIGTNPHMFGAIGIGGSVNVS